MIPVDISGKAAVSIFSSAELDNLRRQLASCGELGMGRRKLLKVQDRQKLFDVPMDEDSLIRHYSLSSADRLEIELRRRKHNQLGFAVQLCLMRYPGRVLATDEAPPRAMLKYVADQIGADPTAFMLYARREETRRDHIARLMIYLGVRSATPQDRRAALLSEIVAADMSDNGISIANAIVATLQERGALLPAVETVERLGLAARAIARRRAEITKHTAFQNPYRRRSS